MNRAQREVRNAELVAGWHGGEDIQMLAERFRLNDVTVRGVVRMADPEGYEARKKAVGRPKGGPSRRTPAQDARRREIVRHVLDEDVTLEVAGARFGLTRERVRQILEDEDPVAYHLLQDVRKRRTASRARLETLDAKLRHELALADVDCPTCGTRHAAVRSGNGNRRFCRPRCQEIYNQTLRYHREGEADKHLRSISAWVSRNAEKWSDGGRRDYQVRYANRVLAGETAPIGEVHGRWFVAGSAVEAAALEAWAGDWPILGELAELSLAALEKRAGELGVERGGGGGGVVA